MGRKITQYPNSVSVTPDELSLIDVSEKTGVATYESRKWSLAQFKAWLNANVNIPVVDGVQGQIPLFVQDDEIGSNTRFTFIDNEGTEVGFRFSDSSGNLTQVGVTYTNLESQGTASNSVLRLANWADNTNKGIISFRKSRGTKSAPSQILNGDILGHIIYAGESDFGTGTTTCIVEVKALDDYTVYTDAYGYARNALTELNVYLAPSVNEGNLTPSGFPNNLVFSVNGDGLVKFLNYAFPISDGGVGETFIADGAGNLVWGTPSASSATSMQTIGRNATGATLRKGTIVSISGSTGNRPNFVKAQANSEATSAGTFGVVVNDIPNNSDGFVATIGTLETLDTRSTASFPFTTDTLADGDTIYLSPTNAGYVTNVKPSAPNHVVYIGKVVRTSPTLGTIVYRIQNGYELEELHNVAISGLADNDILQYESSTSLWKNKQLNFIDGSGTQNYLPKFTPDGNTIGDSKLIEDGTNLVLKGSNPLVDILSVDLTTGGFILQDGTGNFLNYLPQSNSLTISNDTNMFSFTLKNQSDNFWQHIRFIRLRQSGGQALSGDILGSIGHLGHFNFVLEATQNHDNTNNYYGKQVVIGGTQNNGNSALRTLILTQDNKVKISNVYHLPNTDGTSGQVLTTDGAGNVSWTTGGSTTEFIPKLKGNEVFRGVTFANNSTTITVSGGITNNLSGAQGANSVATTNYRTRQHTMRFEPSVVTTGNYCCMRNSALLWAISGGFYFVGDFGISDQAYAVGTHNFWGLTDSIANLAIGTISNSQPSNLTNIIAVANDSGDANLQIMHNDSTGTATKIDLGSSFPSNRTAGSALTNMYLVELYNAPSSAEVKYRVTNKETGAVAQGTISTNLPTTGTLLAYQAGRSMGTSGGGITNSGRFDVARLGVYNI